MLLNELLQQGAVLRKLRARTTEDALGEMIDGLILAGCVGADVRERVLISLMKREAVSTTGLGGEVAIPHAKVKFTADFAVAFAFSRDGVDFHSADGKAVRYIFLMLSPEDDPYGHLRLLGTIATLVRQEGFLDSLAAAESADRIVELIAEAESNAFRE